MTEKKEEKPLVAESAPAEAKKPESKPAISMLKVVLIVLIVSLFSSAVSVFVYDRFYAQKVAAIDIKGYLAEQKDLYTAGKLTDDQFEAKLDTLEALVDSVPKNKALITGDVAVRNIEIIKP